MHYFVYFSPFFSCQITKISIYESHPEEQISSDLWNSFSRLQSLEYLSIDSSSLNLPHQPPILHSVGTLVVYHLDSEDCRGLMASLPNLKHFTATVNDAEKEIGQLAMCLLENEKKVMSYIALHGLHAQQRVVPEQTMADLCSAIRFKTTMLEDLELHDLFIEETSLVRLIEACRTVKSIRTIW